MKAALFAVLMTAGVALGANTLPLSSTWNIAPAGKAAASGELEFRVTLGDGSDPVEVSVAVASGTAEDGIARSIQRALSTQLRADRFNVTLGESANVLVTDQLGKPSFSLELVNSDVENVRVSVQSVAAVPPPTVTEQNAPANPPVQRPATPPAPGDAAPPATAPAATVPTAPSPAPSNATGGAGAPASTPAPVPTPAPQGRS